MAVARAGSAVAVVRKTRAVPLGERLVRRLVALILRGEGIRARIAVVVVGDRTIRSLNRRFLGHDRATDVLAFDLGEPALPAGEVVVSAETARREGLRRCHGPRAELLLYIAHGILHVLGWTDGTPATRRAMNARAAAYVRGLGIPVND